MKNYIKYISIVSLTALFLSACGGEDGSFKGEGSTTISLVGITCVTTPTATDIDGYETLESGDTIIKDDDNTSISIYHDVDGLKKVCLVSGSAHILR